MLNTKGGELVIGVHEKDNNKELLGIEREGFDSNDQYERHLGSILARTFGPAVSSKYINFEILTYEDKSICLITCKQFDGEDPIYFDNKLFVRTGPQISELVGVEQAKYIRQKFDKSKET